MEYVDKKLRVLYIIAVVVWLVLCIVRSFTTEIPLSYHLGLFMLFAPIPEAINQAIGIVINKEIWGNTVMYLTVIIVCAIGLLLVNHDFVVSAGAKMWVSCIAIFVIPLLLRIAWKTLKN